MSQDKELEIQLQFLDEALDYLSTLDSALLGLTNSGIDVDKMNAALRSAHSIKGGAGMMGFQTLNELAHRLEDSFKVLKVQRQTIQLDSELEQLLLAGVDCLRQTVYWQRQQVGIDPNWLSHHAYPIFEQLYQRLGEPTAEDAQSILSPEEGQEIIPLLFQTEVEGCLQRLESVLDTDDPRLREEVEILTQELGGLGEMLQLAAFTQLCESIAAHLIAHPEQTRWVAEQALHTWRQSQAIILSGNWDSLPNQLEENLFNATDTEFVPQEFVSQNNVVNVLESEPNDAEPVDPPTSPPVMPQAPLLEVEQVQTPQIPQIQAPQTPEVQVIPSRKAAPEPAVAQEQTNFRIPDPQPVGSAIPSEIENTVRVPVKQLDQLNDLFSELVIERNGLELHLKRLRGLVQTLGHRVRVLEESNAQLRDAYDKVETQTSDQPAVNSFAMVRVSPPSTSKTDHNREFDALEMDRYNPLHLLSQEVMETIVQVQEVTSDIELGLDDADQTTRELNKTSRQLQTRLTQVRMRPFSDITNRFPRALRELSLQHQKPVQLKIQGEQLMIDRNILEALGEPLMHLLRNAFDHGIEKPEVRKQQGKLEQGLIHIQAIHRQNRTIITVSDDGAGIPIDKIRSRARQMGLDEVLLGAASDEELLSLIFEPGFSTSEQVTALSGRGVGMDVVRDRLKQIQGEVSVSTQAGKGTKFTLSVPFTLSIARVLVAESRGMLLAFSTDAIEEISVVQPDQIFSTAGSQAFNWNGTMVQLIQLSQWLHFHRPFQPESLETPAAIGLPTVLLLNQGSQWVGMQVDRCWGEQEVAVRQVEGGLPLPAGFSSCTILGDGRVVPLVNVTELLHWIASCERTTLDSELLLRAAQQFPAQLPAQLSAQLSHQLSAQLSRQLPSQLTTPLPPSALPPISPVEPQLTVLIVDDSINVRRFLALTLEKAGYQVAQAKDGQDAIDKLSAGLTVQAVICDIEMPRVDGYEFLARVKSMPKLKQIPVAMLTSRSGEKHRRLAMSLGATAYFSKPYNEQTLLQTLEKMIGLTPVS
jgi:chemosensory pili system protein ChpA (sensor histidine kinase/response regulator)